MKSFLLLIALVLSSFLTGAVQAETQEVRDYFAEGSKLCGQGKLDEGLKVYQAGWDGSQNVNCLKGIAAVHTKREDWKALEPYIPAITKAAKNDKDLLTCAFTFSLRTKDEKLFRRCLGLVRGEWVENSQMLQYGISAGAVMFFADKEPEGE